MRQSVFYPLNTEELFNEVLVIFAFIPLRVYPNTFEELRAMQYLFVSVVSEYPFDLSDDNSLSLMH